MANSRTISTEKSSPGFEYFSRKHHPLNSLPGYCVEQVELLGALHGDESDAIKLVCRARSLCEFVEDLRVRQPTLATEIARMLPDWPALVGRHKAARDRLLPTLRELQLAEDHPAKSILAPKRKGMDLGSDKNSVALEIWEKITQYRRDSFSDLSDSTPFRALPPFSRRAFTQWWNLGWPYFVKSIGGDPFYDRRLQRERTRIEGVANSEGVTAASRVATEVRKAAKALWPQMAGISDKIGV